jgi:chaperonin GroEL
LTSSRQAVESCVKQIAENAGHDGDVVVEKIKEGGKGGNFGFNAATASTATS